MKNIIYLLIILLVIISCSTNDSAFENVCQQEGNGYVKIKKYSSSIFTEYEIDSAYYSTIEQSFMLTNKSRDYLNSLNPFMEGINFYMIQFGINSTIPKEGTYTHLYPIYSDDTDVFNIGLTIRENDNPDLNFYTQPLEIPPNGGTLIIQKNENGCYNIDFQYVTFYNDTIIGNYNGGFKDFIPN